MLGTGIIKGLIETGRNFVGSYHDEARLTTVEYPEQKIPPKENNRNFPFLVFDGNDPQAGLRCVACQICEKECPPQCIYIIKSKDKKPDHVGKPQLYPATFDIDVSVCMSCQICVEVCPFDAIKMDQEFELSTSDRFGKLLLDKTRLAKSNEYFHELHPTEAAEVDERLNEDKKKAEAKAKADAEAKAKAAAAPLKAPAPAPATTTPSAVATAASPTPTAPTSPAAPDAIAAKPVESPSQPTSPTSSATPPEANP
jgi:NADH-quinone oxidoreductase subunit I